MTSSKKDQDKRREKVHVQFEESPKKPPSNEIIKMMKQMNKVKFEPKSIQPSGNLKELPKNRTFNNRQAKMEAQSSMFAGGSNTIKMNNKERIKDNF